MRDDSAGADTKEDGDSGAAASATAVSTSTNDGALDRGEQIAAGEPPDIVDREAEETMAIGHLIDVGRQPSGSCESDAPDPEGDTNKDAGAEMCAASTGGRDQSWVNDGATLGEAGALEDANFGAGRGCEPPKETWRGNSADALDETALVVS